MCGNWSGTFSEPDQSRNGGQLSVSASCDSLSRWRREFHCVWDDPGRQQQTDCMSVPEGDLTRVYGAGLPSSYLSPPINITER